MKNHKKAFSLLEISIVILVISILILGIGKGVVLFEKSRLRSAQDLTRYSPIYNIKNLVLWLEPTLDNAFVNQDGSTAIKDGDHIQTWIDLNPQVSIKNSATQSDATNAARPKYIKSGINNLPIVRFDGSDYFRIPKIVTGDWTIIFVYTYRSGGNGSQWYQGAALLGADSPGQANDFGFSVYSTGLNAGVGNTSAATYVTNATASAVGKNYIGIYTRDSLSGQIYLYVNGDSGTVLEAGAIGTGIKNSPAITHFLIGSDPGLASAYFLNGDIAEVIIFSTVLEQEDRKMVEAYLGKKWGIKLQ